MILLQIGISIAAIWFAFRLQESACRDLAKREKHPLEEILDAAFRDRRRARQDRRRKPRAWPPDRRSCSHCPQPTGRRERAVSEPIAVTLPTYASHGHC